MSKKPPAFKSRNPAPVNEAFVGSAPQTAVDREEVIALIEGMNDTQLCKAHSVRSCLVCGPEAVAQANLMMDKAGVPGGEF